VSAAIRNVVVAGSGPLAWIAATGLLRALRHLRLDVCVVGTGSASDARIGHWLLPSQRGMHALLGIAEPHFIHHTQATFKLATEHMGWQGGSSRFLHAHGDIGIEIAGTPFYRLMQLEALAGRAERPETFSLAGTAARLGKFARPMGEGKALTASFTYGYHVADAPYTQYLRAHALRLGVRESGPPLADVMLSEKGAVQALRLEDGSVLAADYFVDCSGPAAKLLSRLDAGEREDWSASLPCNRMLSALAPAVNEAPPLTQTQAATAGWLWRAPLSQASMVGYVYCNRFEDEASARATLSSWAPTASGEARLARMSSGRRRRFWVRNCVALGSAACELEPLAGADLHLAQVGLATFIELFPRDPASSIEAAEYDRIMAEHADSLRDFTLAHYHAGAARSGEFWAAVRAATLPDRLVDRLDLYAASGRINLLDHEIFEEIDWAWLLMGCGRIPAAAELQIRQLGAKLGREEVGAMRTQVQRVAESMPPHMEFVRRQVTLAARSPQ
jgi:tryptophan halogenase